MRIVSCNSLIEIFETHHDINSNNSDVGCDSGTNTNEENVTTDYTTLAIPRLEYINRLELSNLKNLAWSTTSEGTSLSATTLKHFPWSYHNLIEMHLKYNYEDTNIIPTNELQLLQKVERIRVEDCYYAVEVFSLDESQTAVVEVPNLRHLEFISLGRIKYIVRSNHLGSVLAFPNLTTMSIVSCESLEHVFTISMLASFSQLQELSVSNCENLVVVVKETEEPESEYESESASSVLSFDDDNAWNVVW
ncbi:hypothetical protein QVD17_34614 [Tagetes erecta]|uniref:Disease resistance protein At4g27190-like leucine-rich repeats domain-containing protein n=1 Tax=Tagetes erecta TaxID=13708 RepID=A0AAD8JY23_TARER|nr:hypothetical protein QVD17_34614 [Tagetes erecta]